MYRQVQPRRYGKFADITKIISYALLLSQLIVDSGAGNLYSIGNRFIVSS
jgi:hypothetical protein